jgi:DNA-binding MarR family transcriptional regulator
MVNLDHTDRWRTAHLGFQMGRALARYDARVLALMAQDAQVPLGLANLAARNQVGAAHIHITRHLAQSGSRLTDLAAAAGMSKQAMGKLVDQCEAWGLVQRTSHPVDRRAKRVCFTPAGLDWLAAFQRAAQQAQAEFEAAVGKDVATVVAIGLETYAA